jgi:hypothetical protein
MEKRKNNVLMRFTTNLKLNAIYFLNCAEWCSTRFNFNTSDIYVAIQFALTVQ